jgi:hypothetical protein
MKVVIALLTTLAAALSSPSEDLSAIAFVVAVPIPMSAKENQPVMAENVCTRTQVPKAAGPRPWRTSGRETSATTMAQPLASPVAAVLSRTRRRKKFGWVNVAADLVPENGLGAAHRAVGAQKQP